MGSRKSFRINREEQQGGSTGEAKNHTQSHGRSDCWLPRETPDSLVAIASICQHMPVSSARSNIIGPSLMLGVLAECHWDGSKRTVKSYSFPKNNCQVKRLSVPEPRSITILSGPDKPSVPSALFRGEARCTGAKACRPVSFEPSLQPASQRFRPGF